MVVWDCHTRFLVDLFRGFAICILSNANFSFFSVSGLQYSYLPGKKIILRLSVSHLQILDWFFANLKKNIKFKSMLWVLRVDFWKCHDGSSASMAEKRILFALWQGEGPERGDLGLKLTSRLSFPFKSLETSTSNRNKNWNNRKGKV